MNPDPLDAFITLSELSEMFGVPTRSIGNWRGLRRQRIGKTTFFLRSDVANWIERRIVEGRRA